MSILDYFDDWKISAIPRGYGVGSANSLTGLWEKGSAIDSEAIEGVKYNRSAAERYFSQTWAEDVTDVFVTDDVDNASLTGLLVIDGLEYQIDSIVNVGEQEEVWTIGLKIIKETA